MWASGKPETMHQSAIAIAGCRSIRAGTSPATRSVTHAPRRARRSGSAEATVRGSIRTDAGRSGRRESGGRRAQGGRSDCARLPHGGACYRRRCAGQPGPDHCRADGSRTFQFRPWNPTRHVRVRLQARGRRLTVRRAPEHHPARGKPCSGGRSRAKRAAPRAACRSGAKSLAEHPHQGVGEAHRAEAVQATGVRIACEDGSGAGVRRMGLRSRSSERCRAASLARSAASATPTHPRQREVGSPVPRPGAGSARRCRATPCAGRWSSAGSAAPMDSAGADRRRSAARGRRWRACRRAR